MGLVVTIAKPGSLRHFKKLLQTWCGVDKYSEEEHELPHQKARKV